MGPLRRLSRLFTRSAEAAKGIFRREKPPAMIGLPPSARGLTGRPANIAEHASVVAREWEDVAEAYVQKTMRELGVTEQRIGRRITNVAVLSGLFFRRRQEGARTMNGKGSTWIPAF